MARKQQINDDPFAALAVGLSADAKAAAQAKPDADMARVEDERPSPVTPPAPGEDRETVFERRLARLTELLADQPLASGTAVGDATDAVLDLVKHKPAYATLDENEKRSLVRHVQDLMRDLVRRLVLLIASEEAQSIQATFQPQFTVKGEAIEAKVKIEGVDNELLGDAFRLAGHRVVIISADDRRHSATRRDPVVEPDQADMFDGPAPVAATPTPITDPAPEGDDDLADGDDSESVVDTVKRDAAPAFGVFDVKTNEWLADETATELIYTDQAADAKRMTRAEADDAIVKAGAEGQFEVRELP